MTPNIICGESFITPVHITCEHALGPSMWCGLMCLRRFTFMNELRSASHTNRVRAREVRGMWCGLMWFHVLYNFTSLAMRNVICVVSYHFTSLALRRLRGKLATSVHITYCPYAASVWCALMWFMHYLWLKLHNPRRSVGEALTMALRAKRLLLHFSLLALRSLYEHQHNVVCLRRRLEALYICAW